ncbi:MAG: hypothetical protein AB1721_00355 [Patescibacteria group bacterium]
MDWKFIITTTISVAAVIIAFLQYRGKKEEEKKIESLKVLVGVLKGWREYIQSAVNANIIIRNGLRGRTDESTSVPCFSSNDDAVNAVEVHGSYLNGLHVSAERQITEIERIFNQSKKSIKITNWLSAILLILILSTFGFWVFSQIEIAVVPNSQSVIANSLVALKLPVDILGALAGGAVGLILVLIWDWISRPKVKFLGFISEQVNFGTLYKLRFKITGRQNPGICQLEIRWNGNSVKAKWDETPNPLENDQMNQFRAELVPATFYQPLFLQQEYKVPIVHRENNYGQQLSVFSGWWFGRNNGYDPNPSVDRDTELTLILSGNNFQWSKKVKVSEITNERS